MNFEEGVAFSFNGQSVFIAIPVSRNLFEMNSSQLNSYKGLEESFTMLAKLLGVLEDLDLKTRIWTKA